MKKSEIGSYIYEKFLKISKNMELTVPCTETLIFQHFLEFISSKFTLFSPFFGQNMEPKVPFQSAEKHYKLITVRNINSTER